MTGDRYVQSVIDQLPEGLPLRDHVATELRSHIAERLDRGQPLDAVLQQLGDPLTLAESYLSAVPFESAPLLPRFAAKAIDAAAVAGAAAAVGALFLPVLPPEARPFLLAACLVGASIGFLVYTIISEYLYGQTLGKRLMGIRVVRESGARISLGQSLVRQIPLLGQFFLIDALFAVFTDRRQRAFELLTKTRAVSVVACVALSVSATA